MAGWLPGLGTDSGSEFYSYVGLVTVLLHIQYVILQKENLTIEIKHGLKTAFSLINSIQFHLPKGFPSCNYGGIISRGHIDTFRASFWFQFAHILGGSLAPSPEGNV